MSKKQEKHTPTKKTAETELSPKRAILFYTILILLPFLFFVLLEAGLRLFSYGHDLSQWKEVQKDKLILNPEIAYRYFYNTEGVPYSAGEAFDKIKKENSFRVFVIGESSAAGYPYSPNGSIAKYIRKRLQLLNPYRKIEVVNISMAAINSYTLLDLFPGIIEQKPDLILCYTGHNEYYGALGVGSAESVGGYRTVVKTVLFLNKFKTTQLIRNGLKSFFSLFGGDKKQQGTLMSRMAEDQQIILNSDKYHAGLEQFRENMREMARLSSDAGIPFAFGTLISNLKDQPPFISVQADNLPPAAEVFRNARMSYDKGDYRTADSLFRYAKDLDALRFRASEDLNNVIREIALNYNLLLTDIDSAFSDYAAGQISGNEYMTDHLHPTVTGYQMIGEMFFRKLQSENLIPDEKTISPEVQDSLVRSDYDFTELDSTIARYRIITLKSDWPYVDKPKPVKEVLAEINPQTFTDSLALYVVDGKLDWEKSHRQLAMYYLLRSDVHGFLKEMDVLIDQYPFIKEYHSMAAGSLVERELFDTALPYLYGYYEVNPDAFSSKWIGIIELSKGNTPKATQFLEKSCQFNPNDAQVLYNLSGAYAIARHFDSAIKYINRCLELDRNFPGASELKAQLLQAVKVNGS